MNCGLYRFPDGLESVGGGCARKSLIKSFLYLISRAKVGGDIHTADEMMPRFESTIAIFLAATCIATSQPAIAENCPGCRTAIELDTHNSIVINGSPQEIWPYIVDPADWKQGGKLVHSSGPYGAGEIFKAINPDDGSVEFYVKNVEFLPNERRTIKLYLPDGGALIGYASWSLERQNGGTRVSYDVYSETLLSAEQIAAATASDWAVSEKGYQESNSMRFDRELQALKVLVEAGDGVK